MREGKRRADGHVYHGNSVAGREQDVIMYSDKRSFLRSFDNGFFVVVLWCIKIRVKVFLTIVGLKFRSCSQAPGDAQACRFTSEHSAIRQKRLDVVASLDKLVDCEKRKLRHRVH